MFIELGGYLFDDPVIDPGELEELSGVYVVLDAGNYDVVLDVGSSKNVKERIESHDRRDQWKEHTKWFAFAVHWCFPCEMRKIEEELRLELKPLCGKR